MEQNNMQQLEDALRSQSNNPLLPFTSATLMQYVMLIVTGIYIYRKDIVDASERISADQNAKNLKISYDFIIVGGGSAGCVLTNRLSENPNWQILLLEAGGGESLEAEVPVLVGSLALNKSINWAFQTEPSTKWALSLNNRVNWPRGKSIGGSSVLNYMLYVRGNKKDYDRWRDVGNAGWGYNDVLPYFKKSEDIRIPSLRDSPYHGKNGYLSVEELRYQFKIVDVYQAASEEIGYDVTDINGAQQTGFTRCPCTIREGLRDSTAKAFLRPIKKRPNLHISLNSFVTKILINKRTRTAVGVQFTKTVNGRAITKTVYAKKEVILSAGSVQSPQLLMLSGVGPRRHLRENAIDVILDSPGVGQNLQDHVGVQGITYLIRNPPEEKPYGISLRFPYIFTDKALASFLENDRGPLYALPPTVATMFVNSRFSNDTDWPDVQMFLAPSSVNSDGGSGERIADGLTQSVYDRVYQPYNYNFSIGIIPIFVRPYSRGYIKLRDKNPASYPLIYPNYFGDPRDMKVLIDGVNIVQRLVKTKAMRKYEITLNPNRIPGCENYIFQSDAYWECHARHYTATIYHPSGTCKMGPRNDKSAVVDERLRVYGIKNLRVVDASIIPFIPSGNINAPVIMIAEKAADMIKRDHRSDIK